eukprot:123248-Chlamydomonas_euryale.AAC.4
MAQQGAAAAAAAPAAGGRMAIVGSAAGAPRVSLAEARFLALRLLDDGSCPEAIEGLAARLHERGLLPRRAEIAGACGTHAWVPWSIRRSRRGNAWQCHARSTSAACPPHRRPLHRDPIRSPGSGPCKARAHAARSGPCHATAHAATPGPCRHGHVAGCGPCHATAHAAGSGSYHATAHAARSGPCHAAAHAAGSGTHAMP